MRPRRSRSRPTPPWSASPPASGTSRQPSSPRRSAPMRSACSSASCARSPSSPTRSSAPRSRESRPTTSPRPAPQTPRARPATEVTQSRARHRRARKRTARQARKVPGVAQAEGQIKGAVASEEDLAIARYDSLTAEEIVSKLPELSQIDLAKVDSYERKNDNRTTVLSRISALRRQEPWPGYDELTVAEIEAALGDSDEQRTKDVAAYERAHAAGVLERPTRDRQRLNHVARARTGPNKLRPQQYPLLLPRILLVQLHILVDYLVLRATTGTAKPTAKGLTEFEAICDGAFRRRAAQVCGIRNGFFPFDATQEVKRGPLVSNYDRIGLRASHQMTLRFPDAGLAAMAGARNKRTIVDINGRDTLAERLVADVQREFGPAKVVVQPAQMVSIATTFFHKGEKRKIRPNPQRPIDIIGDREIVLPPTRGYRRNYEIIHGQIEGRIASADAAFFPLRR